MKPGFGFAEQIPLNGVAAPVGMRYIPEGAFLMGSDRAYPEEAPQRKVTVPGFWIDETPVTNANYATFVDATGYRTFAEEAPRPADYPGMIEALARPGSLVFEQTAGPVDLIDSSQWWKYRIGANWKRPRGPNSTILELGEHPVVHIAYNDAVAYADWTGKALPSETEWEYAARGGLMGQEYAWGSELAPGGHNYANYWHGLFPFANQRPEGWDFTSPVGAYPANGFGLHDMIGNVWEWTSDLFAKAQTTQSKKRCCGGSGRTPTEDTAVHVLKGGSFLCAENYCQRYRPSARHPQPIDTSTCHVGFRCVIREAPQRRAVKANDLRTKRIT